MTKSLLPARLAWHRLVLAALMAGCLSACGSSSATPTTPSPQQPTPLKPPPGPPVNLAGSWTGTFESANFSTRTMTMTLYQASNCVDGAWASSASEWTGALSGYAGAEVFLGQISFERVSDSGGKCNAVADVSGDLATDTIRLTSNSWNAVAQCTGDLPRAVVITLRRQQ